MKTIGYCYSHKFLEHDLPGHPESADRLAAVMHTLARHESDLPTMKQLSFDFATKEQLYQLHTRSYVDHLERTCAFGGGILDGGDTYTNDASFDAAALAVGASKQSVRAVFNGEVDRAIALPRPPGHHAYSDHAEGFCLFNNVAFAAHCAIQEYKCERVLIMDWDVHHGNGTEQIFYDNKNVMYISTHQHPLYPGTGAANDIGTDEGLHHNVNIPLPAGVGDGGYLRAFEEVIAPIARRYQPQLILISAGFDPHWRDPLANMRMSIAGFAQLAEVMCQLSDELCNGKLVTVLEGGYDHDALGYGVLNTIRVMAGQSATSAIDPVGKQGSKEHSVVESLDQVKRIHSL
jgi:acetoin utilization deacetylase AcuC-like enzyme